MNNRPNYRPPPSSIEAFARRGRPSPLQFLTDSSRLPHHPRFKQLTGTMTDLSWPDEPGLFTGDDGTVYDVVISIESDTVRCVHDVHLAVVPLFLTFPTSWAAGNEPFQSTLWVKTSISSEESCGGTILSGPHRLIIGPRSKWLTSWAKASPNLIVNSSDRHHTRTSK